jgi:hypothetical protein
MLYRRAILSVFIEDGTQHQRKMSSSLVLVNLIPAGAGEILSTSAQVRFSFSWHTDLLWECTVEKGTTIRRIQG